MIKRRWYLFCLGCKLHCAYWRATVHIYVQVRSFFSNFKASFERYLHDIAFHNIWRGFSTDGQPRYPGQDCSLQVHISCTKLTSYPWVMFIIQECNFKTFEWDGKPHVPQCSPPLFGVALGLPCWWWGPSCGCCTGPPPTTSKKC